MAAAGWSGWWLSRLGLTGLGVVLLAALAFSLLPGDLNAKAQLALHGLCAQRPSHSLGLDGRLLPYDARMTGLYLGLTLTALPLLLRRRRGVRLGYGWLALLSGLVGLMALDGLNGLLVDLGRGGWWVPDNRLRLLSGLLAGNSFGVALAWLLNLGLWPRDEPLLRVADGLGWLVGNGLVALGLLGGAGWLLVPVTLLLLVGTLLAIAGLNLALLALGWPSLVQRRPTGLLAAALLAGLIQIAGLAVGRLWLEHWLLLRPM
jgi:uncharacterized membrane protein